MSRLVTELPRTLRTLVRNPGFTFPIVLVLALAIGAETAIFTVVDGVLLEPLPLPQSRSLISLCEHHPSLEGYCVMSPPNLMDLGDRSRTMADVGLARDWPFVLSTAEGSVGIRGGIATPSFLRLLRVQPIHGRWFREDEVGPGMNNVALLSYAYWTSRFGADPAAVGSSITVDGEPNTIIGVLPAEFEFPGLFGIEVWKPLHVDPRLPDIRRWRGFKAVARLRDGSGLSQVRAELASLYNDLGREHEEVSAEWRLGVTSLQDALVGDVRPTLVLFLVAVTILLTIACANVANLFLVRGVRRERQFAVRTALGARRRDLAADVLLESVVLSTAGGIGGLILGWSVLRFFLLAAPPGIPRLDEVGLDPRALGFAIGLSLLTALLFGAIPAWRAESGNLSEGLRSGRSTVGGGHKRIQQAIVVAELALSLALLATAGLVLRTFSGYTRWDPGYRTDGVLVFSAQFGRTKYRNSAELQAGFDQMEAALRSLPGVAAEGMASGWPLVGGIEPRPFVPEGSVGEPGTEPASANYFEVSPGYLEALGIALLEGRTLQSSDRAGSLPVVVVNRTLTQMAWRDESPVGKRIFFPDYDETAVVVGVVADVPPLVPGDPTPAQVYWSNRQHTRPVPYFVVTADGDATLLARAARARLLEVDPDLSVSTVRSLEDVVAGNLVQPRFTLYLVAAFAVAALILAVLGIYAVIAFAVAQRSREFGIRLALGSTSRELLRSVLFDAGRLAVLGALVGLVGTLSVAKLLGRVVHGVAPNDPLTIGTAAAALLLAATLACMVPAIRAGRVNVRSILADS